MQITNYFKNYENQIDKAIGMHHIRYRFNNHSITIIIVDMISMWLFLQVTCEYSKETDEFIFKDYLGALFDQISDLKVNKDKSDNEILDICLNTYGESRESLKDKLLLYMTRGMTNDLITSCNGSV